MSQQDKRIASVTTPLGSDKLLFDRMSGHEALSRLFEYEVDLLVDGKNTALVTSGFPTNNVLGQAMTIAMTLPTGGTRYFHGLVTQFRQHGTSDEFYVYRAVLRPWLWFLTRTSNCRIFQELSVPDIIKKVFETNGFSDFKLELTKTYNPREYCVQYRESDFNFVSRLMEYEGIFYYFKHEKTQHTLIIADSVSAYQTVTDYDTIPYLPPDNTGQRKRDNIYAWHTTHQVQSGAYVLNDYDFEQPNNSLISKFTVKKPHSHAEGEQYDYPGNYIDHSVGDSYSNIRLDELQTDFEIIQGSSNAMGMTTGMLFTLKDHYIQPENTKHIVTLADFIIVSNQYRATAAKESYYECHFRAIRSTQQFRPQRLTPIPFVQGPQTATVVGKSGEEIWTDKYGRIKVQFHWDREGEKNENSSCWMRVSYPIAGKNWGWVSLPRMGQEVVVSFLEGNPDRPLITGSVYNANQMPPYALPENKTQSGLKSRSSKKGDTQNFNELRFEDKKGSEQIYIHAEKNQDNVVENDETTSVGHDRTEDVGHDEKITIGNNRTEKVVVNEDITIGNNRTEKVGVNENITIGANRTENVGANESITIAANRTKSVGASETVSVALQRTHAVGINETIAVGAAQEVAIGAYQTINVGAYQSINIGANQSTDVGANQSTSVASNQSLTVGGNQSEAVSGNASKKVDGDDALKVGKTIVIDAGDSITLKTGSASITMKKNGDIVIKGKNISVDGSGKIDAKASNNITMKGQKILQN